MGQHPPTSHGIIKIGFFLENMSVIDRSYFKQNLMVYPNILLKVQVLLKIGTVSIFKMEWNNYSDTNINFLSITNTDAYTGKSSWNWDIESYQYGIPIMIL